MNFDKKPVEPVVTDVEVGKPADDSDSLPDLSEVIPNVAGQSSFFIAFNSSYLASSINYLRFQCVSITIYFCDCIKR